MKKLPLRTQRILHTYPSKIQERLLVLRDFIYKTAKPITPLIESVKWGEIAFLTRKKTGSTIRIGYLKKRPTKYAIYFNCQTTLVESFKKKYPTQFAYEKNRAILFDINDSIPKTALKDCLIMALTYHQQKAMMHKDQEEN